jgi:hypothetical protein
VLLELGVFGVLLALGVLLVSGVLVLVLDADGGEDKPSKLANA